MKFRTFIFEEYFKKYYKKYNYILLLTWIISIKLNYSINIILFHKNIYCFDIS